MVAFDIQMLSRSLIGGMEVEGFNCEVRERRAAKFAAAITPEQPNQLCSLSKLESLVKREAIPILYVDVFDGGHLRKLADVQKKSGKSALTAVADSFRRGSTIRVRHFGKFDAGLNHFVGEVQRSFLAQSQINVFLTPPVWLSPALRYHRCLHLIRVIGVICG